MSRVAMDARGPREKKDHPEIRDLWHLRGEQGTQGPKGDPGLQAMPKNWKQCAWKDINEGKDYGMIKVRKKPVNMKEG